MTRGNPGATRWVLTCPDCGRTWELVGHGRWQKHGLADLPNKKTEDWPAQRGVIVGAGLEGPAWLAERGEPITRTVHRLLQCYDCETTERARKMAAMIGFVADSVPGLFEAITPFQQWSYMKAVIEKGRAIPADSDGMKRCLYCGERYAVGRRNVGSCWCPDKPCAQNVKRRMDRLRKGLPLTRTLADRTPAMFRWFLNNAPVAWETGGRSTTS